MANQLGPSINLPPQILPNVPPLPRPNLDAPSAVIPSYTPMLVPSGALRGPTGTEEDEEEGLNVSLAAMEEKLKPKVLKLSLIHI